MRDSRVRALWSVLALSGCGRDPDVLHAYFVDETVEAPARQVDITGIKGADCEKALSRLHDAPGADETIAATTRVAYPVNPDSDPLTSFPKDTPMALDVAALDEAGHQVGRGCIPVSLDSGAGKTIDLELRTLPRCETDPLRLDIMLVVDASATIVLDDAERHYVDVLRDVVLGENSFVDGTSFGLVTFGPDNRAIERVEHTTDRESIRVALAELYSGHAGQPVLHDAIVLATSISRARAVCGRKSAMLVLLGHPDAEFSKASFWDALVAISSSQGDPTDDLYTYGIALSEGGYQNLDLLVPEGSGFVTGAGTAALQDLAARSARESLSALLAPPAP
ncbi:MAG: VWA domain-containing protein [Deltaproteobacteria bacterium]|nr:VWA domain-containing protein [Deltaproteobacteria bacterium]